MAKKKKGSRRVEPLNRASLFNYYSIDERRGSWTEYAELFQMENGKSANEQTNHRAVMTSESDASGERGGKRAQPPLNRPLFSITSRPSPPPLPSTVFSPVFWSTLHRCDRKQRKTDAPRTLTRCVVFIPTTRYWNSPARKSVNWKRALAFIKTTIPTAFAQQTSRSLSFSKSSSFRSRFIRTERGLREKVRLPTDMTVYIYMCVCDCV